MNDLFHSDDHIDQWQALMGFSRMEIDLPWNTKNNRDARASTAQREQVSGPRSIEVLYRPAELDTAVSSSCAIRNDTEARHLLNN